MRKGLTFLLPAALSVLMAAPLFADEANDPATVVARVNGTEITLGHIIVTFAALPQQYQQLPAETLYPNILEQLIQQTALAQSLGTDDPLYVKLSVENEHRALRAAEEIDRVLNAGPSDAEIQAAYDAEYSEGFGGEEFNASHILVETEDEAKALKSQLDTGADFVELAKEKSTGPSGPNGGSLGWFGLGAMVPEFETAVVALEPGQVSEPIQTQFGWHVVKLNEKRKESAPLLSEVREEIGTRLQTEIIEQRVSELTAAANVERPEIEGLDANIIKNLDLVRN
jgi:peptidyl-prolyl cis-trans isomerase C